MTLSETNQLILDNFSTEKTALNKCVRKKTLLLELLFFYVWVLAYNI